MHFCHHQKLRCCTSFSRYFAAKQTHVEMRQKSGSNQKHYFEGHRCALPSEEPKLRQFEKEGRPRGGINPLKRAKM
jgi:hypothetical protein